MKTRSTLLLFLTYFLFLSDAFPQLYQWRLGIATGYTNHYGHLSTYRLDKLADIQEVFRPTFPLVPESNWSLGLEKRLSSGLGLSIHGGRQALAGYGSQFSERHPSQQHSMRYQSSLWNIGSALIFRMDDGKILQKTSFLAPYALIGTGWHAWESQTLTPVSDGPQLAPSEFANELVIGQNSSGERFYLDLGLGLRVRISQQFEVFIQSNAQTNGAQLFEGSGVLLPSDGISNQAIQAGPDRAWLFQHQMGIKFSFAPKRSSFTASVISPSSGESQNEVSSPAGIHYGVNPPISDTIQGSVAEDRFLYSPSNTENVDSMAPSIYPIPYLYSQGDPESETVISPLENLESRDLPLTSRAYTPEPEYSDDRSERTSIFPSFYPVYPIYSDGSSDNGVYPERNSDFSREESQQEHQRSLYPSGRYSNTRPNQSSERIFVPIIAPLGRRPVDTGRYTEVAEKNSELPMGLPLPADSLSETTGLRLNPQIPMGSKALPIPRSRLPEIVIQDETPDTIATALRLPAIYTDVYFEINQSELSDDALIKLGEIASTLQRFPETTVALKGYADHTGSIAFNLDLVKKRTNSVAKALVEKFGIAKDRIQLQPGAQLVRTRVPSSLPEDRKVEVQILFLNSGIDLE